MPPASSPRASLTDTHTPLPLPLSFLDEQKWIYRVDYSRENEYGQKFDEAEAKKQLDKKAHDEQARIKAEGVETKKTQ